MQAGLALSCAAKVTDPPWSASLLLVLCRTAALQLSTIGVLSECASMGKQDSRVSTNSHLSLPSLLHTLTCLVLLDFTFTSADLSSPAEVQTNAERGIWYAELPGFVRDEAGKPHTAVSMQILLKGLCLGDSIFLRGQMFALSPGNHTWSATGTHLLQPLSIGWWWQIQLYFRDGNFTYEATVPSVGRFVELDTHGQRGVIIPAPFNATLPASLLNKPIAMGIEGFDYYQWLMPSDDLKIQCQPGKQNDVNQTVRVFHVLPPLLGWPSNTAIALLKQHISWDKAIGALQTVLYVTKDNMEGYQQDPSIQASVSTSQELLFLWDQLPSCHNKPYCLKTLIWSHSLLLLWDAEDAWIFMSDLDEFLALPQPEQFVGQTIAGCMQRTNLAILQRFEVVCPSCGDDWTIPWNSTFPLSYFSASAKKGITHRGAGRQLVNVHKTMAVSVHNGLAQDLPVFIPQSCIFVVHVANVYSLRRGYYPQSDFELSKHWMWPEASI